MCVIDRTGGSPAFKCLDVCVIDHTGGSPPFECLDVCVIDHTGGSPPFECLDVCVIDHTGGSTAFKCVVNFTGGKRLLFALHKKRLSYIAENTSFSFLLLSL